MKSLIATLILVALVSTCSAMTIDDIVKLTELKTADKIILSLLEKEPLKTPFTTKEVLFLKQNKVSDVVIDYLLQTTERKDQVLPKQEGESTQISENLRTYYTTNKKGKRVRVVTNLDEKGKRMGKPIPPAEYREEKQYEKVEEAPREIVVTVRHEEPVQPEPDEYPEPPTNGIPLDYVYGPSYYPYSPFFPTPVLSPNCPPRPCCPPVKHINRPQIRQPVQRTPVFRPVTRTASRPSSAGIVRMHR